MNNRIEILISILLFMKAILEEKVEKEIFYYTRKENLMKLHLCVCQNTF